MKNNNQKVTGINGRILFHGGFRQTPILKEESEITGRAVYDHINAFPIKFQDYFRLDAGVYFKKHRKNYTRTVLINIQNLTNRKNIAYQYYNREKNEVRNRYQLGIIPSFNYRIEF